MSASCIICSDVFQIASEVYTTQCGHLFHYVCLINWIERSKTCPQCRQRVTEKNVHRVYFNFLNADCIQDDAATLQNKLDNLRYEMSLKEKDIKNYTEKYKKVKTQNVELRKEIIKLEAKDRSSTSAMHALKEQVKFFKSKVQENGRLSEEIKKLQAKLKETENISLAVKGTREEVNEMLRNEKNVESLVLLAATLKKTLLDVEHRKHEIQFKLKSSLKDNKNLQSEVDNLKGENNRLISENFKLNNELVFYKKQWEKEKKYMKKKLISCGQDENNIEQNTSLKRVLDESPIPQSKLAKLDDSSCIVDLTKNHSLSLEEKVKNILDSDSPYLPIKMNGATLSMDSMIRNSRFLANKSSKDGLFKQPPKMETLNRSNELVNYDGLGGSSKPDIFPTPQIMLNIKKSKARSVMSAKFKKVADSNKKKNISDFFNLSS